MQFYIIFDVKKVDFKQISIKSVYMRENFTDFRKCIAKWWFIRICSSQKILMRTSFVFGGDFFSNLTLFRRVSSVFDKRFARMNRISNIWRQNYDFHVFFQIILSQQFFVFAKSFRFPMVGINILFLQIHIFENIRGEPRANTLVVQICLKLQIDSKFCV